MKYGATCCACQPALGMKSRHVKFAEKTQKFSEAKQFTVELEDAPSLAHGLSIGEWESFCIVHSRGKY